MKHILCYGDSNTHGYIPGGGRYDDNTRWTRLLTNLLGDEYLVIEEGLNSRTSSFNDPTAPYKNGMDYIVPCIQTHEPIDLTILMLGSNDMKQRFSPSVEKIADSLHQLTQVILDVSQAPVLLVSPILLGENMPNSPFCTSFPKASLNISRELGSALENVANQLGVAFLNAANFAEPSHEDSLHLTTEGHKALADAFYHKIKEMGI